MYYLRILKLESLSENQLNIYYDDRMNSLHHIKPTTYIMNLAKEEAGTVITKIIEYISNHGYPRYGDLFNLKVFPETRERSYTLTDVKPVSELETFKLRYNSWLKSSGLKQLYFFVYLLSKG